MQILVPLISEAIEIVFQDENCSKTLESDFIDASDDGDELLRLIFESSSSC